jgi:conjugal transfer pilus assembly protein TraV
MNTFNPILKSSVSLGICLLLSACAVSKEHFDCAHGKGVGCQSITEVNDMVDRGLLAAGHAKNQGATPEAMLSHSVEISSEQMRLDFLSVDRVADAPLKIWFAPFMDAEGNFHEASVIHTVLKSGFWRVEDF